MYIVLFLHQTTTLRDLQAFRCRCISYYSYIKPQLKGNWIKTIKVVYRTIPTSNHNLLLCFYHISLLYIVLFLHQTTTRKLKHRKMVCCISYYSYIKPQQWNQFIVGTDVVYRTIPTSNHNYQGTHYHADWVVYRTIPTSNHNRLLLLEFVSKLYIVLFLHQTTTYNVDIADNQHITITFINKK